MKDSHKVIAMVFIFLSWLVFSMWPLLLRGRTNETIGFAIHYGVMAIVIFFVVRYVNRESEDES